MSDTIENSGRHTDGRTRMTFRLWLVVIIASIGFLFDTYVLLTTPLTAPPAIAELLKLPLNHPLVADWTGELLWITALCGGFFGLLGGWLIDKLGRKSVMAGSIFLYSFSPFAAAYSTSVPMFILFRCATFVGVCVEFVAAITWLAEIFEDPRQRARWLGVTQAFASLGGVAVTAINVWIVSHGASLAHIGLPIALGQSSPSTWRYLTLTGILPAIPIALMLPFVPESQVWKRRRAAGTLRRPSFAALFSPQFRRATIVTAILSACAYGIAFGALQLTPSVIALGLPELRAESKALAPLKAKDKELGDAYEKATPGSPEQAAVLAKLKANAKLEGPLMTTVKEVGNRVQGFQETGGLIGRILVALLLIIGIGRGSILRLLQIPSLVALPLVYFVLFKKGGPEFLWVYGACGLLTVAQFSYLGEYLPKVFPLHLRGTGGSFATNVGGRMIGTAMALVTTKVVAPMFAGTPPVQVAKAAGCVALSMAIISLLAGLLLPKVGDEEAPEEVATSPASIADATAPGR